MRGGSRSLATAGGVWLVIAAAPAHAVIFGGGGSSRTDCMLVFDAPVNDPEAKPKKVRCTDGDSSCDCDEVDVNGDCVGIVNGVCNFKVGVCANSTFDPLRCTPDHVSQITVDHAEDNGDPKFDVDFQALQTRIDTQILEFPDTLDRCTTPTTIRVPVSGPFPGDVCKGAKKQIKITTFTFQGAKALKDADKLKMTCDPPVPCDPRVLFPTGTYERIQRQIFNQSCALSGCHDSQSQQAEMLVESSGSCCNIVDAFAFTLAAAARRW